MEQSNWLGQLRRPRITRPDRWGVFVYLLAAVICLPIVAVLLHIGRESEAWDHLAATVLPGYLRNTLILVVAVTAISLLIAVPPAWLVTCFDFPGRRLFNWALVLPLAIPTYVAAFVFYQLPEAAIPLLIKVRMNWGVDAFLAMELVIRYGILIIMLAAVLYPYAYLACRAAFSQQGRTVIEAARCLGDSPGRVFFRVALPMARPAIVAGVALIIMEVINDYGAVNFFGVPTLTEGVFRTWFGMGDKVSALRLASIVMITVAVILAVEQLLRGRARYVEAETGSRVPLSRSPLKGWKALGATAVCLLPLAVGFIYPVYRLTHWALLNITSASRTAFPSGESIARGTVLAALTALIVTLTAAVFTYAVRLNRNRIRGVTGRIPGMGYATPGAVIAVGVMVVFGTLDRWNLPLLPLVSGTLFAVGFAYMVRFFAIPLQFSLAGMERLGKAPGEASRLLGRGPMATLLNIDLPLLKGPLIAAGMLLFVDILKELPLTLILRPANFETLATTAFSLAKEEQLHACAVPSLMIVIAGGAGLLVMNRWLANPSQHD
ncbi:MAG: iron ABC transporter permease [Verrucomicrobiales bacterium]|nr:iron ABC transporter permease [Verrucomicrobiales bacterium]